MTRSTTIPPNMTVARMRTTLNGIAQSLDLAAATAEPCVKALAAHDKNAAAVLALQVSIVRSIANLARVEVPK